MMPDPKPDWSEVRATAHDLDTTGFDDELAAFARCVREPSQGADGHERGYDDDDIDAVADGRVLLSIALVAAEQLRFREGTDVSIKALTSFNPEAGWAEDQEITVVRRRDHGDRLRLQIEQNAGGGFVPDARRFEFVSDQLMNVEVERDD